MLSVVVTVCGGGNSKASQHGVGFPSSKELDVVMVDTGAEEGGGPAGAEAAGTDAGGGDAGRGFEVVGSVFEAVGDVGGLDGARE